MRKALDEVRGRLGRSVPMSLDGRWIEPQADPSRQLRSTDPSESSRVVGVAPLSTARRRPRRPSSRPAVGSAAGRTRRSRCARGSSSRPRRSFADAGSSCAPGRSSSVPSPGARPMATSPRRSTSASSTPARSSGLARPRHQDVPGETNESEYRPARGGRGHPPLELPAGDPDGDDRRRPGRGNAVILKPAEQSPVMAYLLASVLEEAGLPPGVLAITARAGEEVGQALVTHPGCRPDRVHRLARCRLADQPAGGRAPAGPGPRQARDRRDGREECDHRRRRRRPRRGRRRASSRAPSATRGRSARPARG